MKESRLQAIRRAILREWQGGEEGEHPDSRLHQPDEFLDAILKMAGATEGIDEERLRGMWKEVAGDFVSRHASPASLKNGCLTLQVLQPSMRFHLEQTKGVLLKKLQAAAGPEVVRSLRFAIG